MAGPMMRAPLNMDEFSAMAFIRSSLPTMSTRKACRAGMSKAFTTPSKAASTKMCHTCTTSGKRQHRKDQGQNHGRDLGSDHHPLAVVAVGHDAAQRRHQKYGKLAGESHRSQQQRRPGQAIDQPCLGHALHPGADQRNELPAEEKLEIAMVQRAQGDW